jgi:long-chain acyl-CoA synthetase
VPVRTLNELFFDAVDRFSSKRAALRAKRDGAWRDITHQELARRVKHAALGLLELGIAPGSKVAILSENRPEWAVADFGVLTARSSDVPVYPTLPAHQVAYILRDSGATAIFVSDREQYAKVAEMRAELPALEHVIRFDTPPESEHDGADGVITHQALLQRGAAAEARYPDYERAARAAEPDDLATLIYTSGTTGDPKGVMLTHGNFTSNVLGALEVFDIGPGDSCLSLLPLSHSFERMAGHYTMFHAGATINYAESIDAVSQNMLEVRPTVMLAVPRLYEKIYARVLENAVAGGRLKRAIFFWAKRNAEAWADLVLAGTPVRLGLNTKKAAADALVFSKLKERTGGRIRFFISGGAPLAPEIAKFFYAAGLPILEGYGMTETSPVLAVNPLSRPKIGTVGPALPNVELRIAEDGEILARGPNVMKGYYNKPEATREALEPDGWLHTGDIGELDADGYLKITDRKKDIIVTAGGKNIAPQPIENLVKMNKFVENAVMIGDKRKFPMMLIVPNMAALTAWAAHRNLPTDDPTALLEHPDVVAKVEREVALNLRDLAHYETPKKFLLIPEDFTVESGELTPTLKVKRRVVEKKYREQIDKIYADAERDEPKEERA